MYRWLVYELKQLTDSVESSDCTPGSRAGDGSGNSFVSGDRDREVVYLRGACSNDHVRGQNVTAAAIEKRSDLLGISSTCKFPF